MDAIFDRDYESAIIFGENVRTSSHNRRPPEEFFA
jgi:hypothetical protein